MSNVSFNLEGNFYRLASNDAFKNVINQAEPQLTWLTVTDSQFLDLRKRRLDVIGKSGSSVTLRDNINEESSDENVFVFKENAEIILNNYINFYTDYINNNSNAISTQLATDKTTLQNVNLDTIITWETVDGKQKTTDYKSLEDILLSNNVNFLTLNEIV
tara:strand:- start:4265 stop:4744 length:480 start_codon:yes stop_codon:yes gene_type:complete